MKPCRRVQACDSYKEGVDATDGCFRAGDEPVLRRAVTNGEYVVIA